MRRVSLAAALTIGATSLTAAPKPAAAGPTVKKKAWSTYTQIVDVESPTPWGTVGGVGLLPSFSCPDGAQFRLMALQAFPSDVVPRSPGRPLDALGEWRVWIPLSAPYDPLTPAQRGIGGISVSGRGSAGGEVRFDGGLVLGTPLGNGVPDLVYVSTSAPGPGSATFTVVLTGACGTDGDVIVGRPRGL
jgi:hypothetical protein